MHTHTLFLDQFQSWSLQDSSVAARERGNERICAAIFHVDNLLIVGILANHRHVNGREEEANLLQQRQGRAHESLMRSMNNIIAVYQAYKGCVHQVSRPMRPPLAESHGSQNHLHKEWNHLVLDKEKIE